MKNALNSILYVAIFAMFTAFFLGFCYFVSSTAEARGLANIRAGCAAVERMRVSTRIMDGEAWFGPIDHACWAKGLDGRWRQVDRIVGPDADFYPAGMRDLYIAFGDR